MVSDSTSIAENIKLMRQTLNLTQDEVAIKAHCFLGTYKKYEYGTSMPSLEIMVQIGEAMGGSLSDVLKNTSYLEQMSKTEGVTANLGITIIAGLKLELQEKEQQLRESQISINQLTNLLHQQMIKVDNDSCIKRGVISRVV